MPDMADKKTRSFTFRTSDDVLAELERIAKQEDRTLSWLADRAIRDWLTWRRGTYDGPSREFLGSEAAAIAELWSKLAPSQRKLIRDMMKNGTLEVRDNTDPVLNEPSGQY